MQLISGDAVLPGPAGERIADGAVLIDGDTITAVGSRADIERQLGEDVQRRHFSRCTVLPGLINSHVHLAFDASADWFDHLQGSDDSDLLLGMAGRAQQALRAGVTTVPDLGDRNGLAIRLRDAIGRGDLVGPRILSAGSPLTVPREHCWFLGGEVNGEAEIRQQVRRTAATGADLIKVMASGGEVTPNSPPSWSNQFSRGELEVVVAEARAAGLRVAAHAHGTQAISDAVAAGVATIEHCSWQRDGGGGADLRADIARQIADRGIYVCHAWPATWRAFAERIGPARSAAAVERVQWMDQLGLPLITGTDAGLRTSVFDHFAEALTYYTDSVGLGPERVLEMATTRSACALGRGDSLGRLAAGCAADLLVVGGDPTSDLAALRDQKLVLTRGKIALGNNA